MSEHEGKYRDERLRGDHAKRLLEDGLFQETFAKVESSIVTEWRATSGNDAMNRERLWLMLKLLEKLKGHISQVATTGDLAMTALAEIDRAKAQRKKHG